MPKMCSNNGLTIDTLPEDLKLSDLENNLVAKNIIFQKVHKKPKSRMAGTHDRMVNIPIADKDILKTITSLPRTPIESRIITVGKLKRKLEYKNNHIEQLIDIQKIFKFLHHLKNVVKNKNYQFYDDYNVYSKRCERMDPEGFRMINPEIDDVTENLNTCQNIVQPEDEVDLEHDSDEDPEDLEYRTKDPVRKTQFDYDMTTSMIPKYPEAIPETIDSELNFAPGEGKIPTNILKEDDWDVNSFPNIHPSGRNKRFDRSTIF